MNNLARYALHHAVAAADHDAVVAALQAGADANLPLPLRPFLCRASLHVCVMAFSDAVRTLNSRRANALSAICRTLLAAGAAVDQRDSSGLLGLHARGLLPSACGEHMPRALAQAVRQLAFDEAGIFSPDLPDDGDDGNFEWLMPAAALVPDALSGGRDPVRYAAAYAHAVQASRVRELAERRLAHERPGLTRRKPIRRGTMDDRHPEGLPSNTRVA